MITGHELFGKLSRHWPSAERSFAFPFTYVDVVADDWPEDSDERETLFASRLEIDVPLLRTTCNRLFLRFELRKPNEPKELPSNRGHFWVRALQEQGSSVPSGNKTIRAVHFYGFKGGQARSSTLAFLALTLAADGWKVLTIDMDAEAPSMDVVLGITVSDASASIVGVRAGMSPRPVRVHSAPGRGFVDLLAFRPEGMNFDIDAAALSMELSIHPQSQAVLISRVVESATKGEYDVVLVDHRTGLSPTVLPWIHQLQGPVVVFARMDGQWRGARRHLAPLWQANPVSGGLLMTAVPANEDLDEFARKHEAQAIELLDELALNAGLDDEDAPEMAGSDLLGNWILWPHDGAFGSGPGPAPTAVGGPVIEATSNIRRLLELTGVKIHLPSRPGILHPSGGADEGHLIQTRALRDLSAPNNPYTYILGRKGTGKTRLLRALAEAGIGQPLLVPDQIASALGGVVAEDPLVQQLLGRGGAPEFFWWTLLDAALSGTNTERERLRGTIRLNLEGTRDPITGVRASAERANSPRVLLIDGLETAFTRELTFPMLAGLFRVAAGLEADPILRERIRLRIFVRTDLAQRGFENFEQQSFGRVLNLAWDTQSILNFALSRIDGLPWFAAEFPQAAESVRGRVSELVLGTVPIEHCDELLLRFFPDRLTNRSNINTSNFLRSWFSDDPKAETSFYPRVYDQFLRTIAGYEAQGYRGPYKVSDRLAPQLIYFAHAHATKRFLEDVRSELRNIVDLPDQDLTSLIDAMKDSITPFFLDKRVDELAAKTGLTSAHVRQALERMKRLGIFEDRPGYAGQWRVGRLFKSSLGMKYNRRRRLELGEVEELEP